MENKNHDPLSEAENPVDSNNGGSGEVQAEVQQDRNAGATEVQPEYKTPAQNNGLADLFAKLEVPKQSYQKTVEATKDVTTEIPSAEPKPEPNADPKSDPIGNGGLNPEKPPGKPGTVSSINQSSGKMIAKTIDLGVGKLGNVFTHQPSKRYRADEEEMEELIEIWALYFEESGGRPPAWLLLVLVCAMVYGPKIPLILQDVARNKAIKAAAADKAQQQQNRDVTSIYSDAGTDETAPDSGSHETAPGESGSKKKTSEKKGSFKNLKVDKTIRFCKNCNKELKPGQEKFCSRKCTAAFNAGVKKASENAD